MSKSSTFEFKWCLARSLTTRSQPTTPTTQHGCVTPNLTMKTPPKSPSRSPSRSPGRSPSRHVEFVGGVSAAKARTKKKRRRKNYSALNGYIYKVLKQVHPEMGISRKGMLTMEGLVADVQDRVYGQLNELHAHGRSKTTTAWDVQSAVRLVFPGELCKHAISEMAKATTKFYASK